MQIVTVTMGEGRWARDGKEMAEEKKLVLIKKPTKAGTGSERWKGSLRI